MRGKRFYGEIGENYAVSSLQKRGYIILGKNFRSRYGEIDIIAFDSGVYVFVEVKTRWSEKFGVAAEAVTPTKLKKIKKTIDYYFFLNKLKNKKARIEVLAIDINKDGSALVKNIVVD